MSGTTTTYQVRYRVSGTTNWITYGTPTTTPNVTISGLSPNTTYDLEVIATNETGSVVSQATTFTTGEAPPAAPSTPVVSNITTVSFVLNWTAANPPDVTYQVQYRVQGSPTWLNWLLPLTSSTTSIAINGLTQGTTYEGRVVATNTVGSTSSAATTATTLVGGNAPAAPTGLSTSNITSSAVTLSWFQSSSGTAPITYQPMYRLTGGPQWFNFGSPLSATSVIITGLSGSTTYDLAVQAINAYGTAQSASVQALTLVPTSAPSVPTNLVLSNAQQTAITLTWTASTGNPPPTYQVQYRTTGSATFLNFGAPISSTSATITGLATGASYDFQVIATNSAGSATSSTVTGSTTASAVAPSVPQSVAAGTITAQSIQINWAAPAQGTPPLTYILQYRPSP